MRRKQTRHRSGRPQKNNHTQGIPPAKVDYNCQLAPPRRHGHQDTPFKPHQHQRHLNPLSTEALAGSSWGICYFHKQALA